MLLGEDLGRSEQGALMPAQHRLEQGMRGHHRFAGTHIALEQPQHRSLAAELSSDLLDHPFLCRGERERKYGGQAHPGLLEGTERRRAPAAMRARRNSIATRCARSSSKARRRTAGCRPSSRDSTGVPGGGRWTNRSASANGGRRSRRSRRGSSTSSSPSGKSESARSTSSRIRPWVMPSTEG